MKFENVGVAGCCLMGSGHRSGCGGGPSKILLERGLDGIDASLCKRFAPPPLPRPPIQAG